MDLVMVALLCVPLYIFASPLSRLFGVSGEEVSQSVEYLRFICLCYPIFALYIPISGMFQGCGDPMAATVGSVTALGVRVAAAYIMALFLGVGYASCWENMLYGWSAALLFDICYYASGRWKTKSLVKNRKAEV